VRYGEYLIGDRAVAFQPCRYWRVLYVRVAARPSSPRRPDSRLIVPAMRRSKRSRRAARSTRRRDPSARPEAVTAESLELLPCPCVLHGLSAPAITTTATPEEDAWRRPLELMTPFLYRPDASRSSGRSEMLASTASSDPSRRRGSSDGNEMATRRCALSPRLGSRVRVLIGERPWPQRYSGARRAARGSLVLAEGIYPAALGRDQPPPEFSTVREGAPSEERSPLPRGEGLVRPRRSPVRAPVRGPRRGGEASRGNRGQIFGGHGQDRIQRVTRRCGSIATCVPPERAGRHAVEPGAVVAGRHELARTARTMSTSS
jgi:hypothetical protein